LIIAALAILTLTIGTLIHESRATELATRSVTAPIYVALPLAFCTLIWLKPIHAQNENDPHYLIFLVAVTWSGDIGAYFFGRLFGRHKLAPRISPGKTVEGFIGGILLTLIVAIMMKLCWNNMNRIFAWQEIIFLALAFSIIGPIGDLAESWLKRSSGIKDSGRTFTGHGGMLDIIDSILFTTVFYYGYLLIFHHGTFHFMEYLPK
jgi:phosphatidate cytidylyltransferase